MHPPDLLSQTLSPSCLKGTIIDDVPPTLSQITMTRPQSSDSHVRKTLPSLSSIFSTYDFEATAQKHLSQKAWAYYSSAATDLVSQRANQSLWDKIWFRPRILRNVKNVVTNCCIQGLRTSSPFYVAPAAMARLAHDDGELAIARACVKNGVVQCVRYFYFSNSIIYDQVSSICSHWNRYASMHHISWKILSPQPHQGHRSFFRYT